MPSLADEIIQQFVRNGILSEDKLELCRSLSVETGRALEELLVEEGFLTEGEILQCYADRLGMEFCPELEDRSVAPNFLDRVPLQFARLNCLVGLTNGEAHMEVATSSPLTSTGCGTPSSA